MVRLLGLTALAACGGGDAQHGAPAATVEHPVGESELTTVTLSPEALQRLGVETAVVEAARVGPTRRVGGLVMAPPGRALTVVAPSAGTVLAPDSGGVPAAGRRVRQGEPLLRLLALPPDQSGNRQAVEVSAARLRQAEAEAKRVSELYRDRLVSARELEQAQADLSAARAVAAAARAQQAQIERGDVTDLAGLAPLRLVAPEAGVVSAVHVAPGQAVAQGTALLELVAVDRLWVRVPLYAGDRRQIAAGEGALVTALGQGSDHPIRAVPVTGPPAADPSSASVDLFYALSAGGFRPGERVTVDLPLAGPGDSTRTVPLSAIVYDAQGGTWVYERLDSLSFARRRVDLARIADGRAALARGPALGATVVSVGAAELFGTEFGAGH